MHEVAVLPPGNENMKYSLVKLMDTDRDLGRLVTEDTNQLPCDPKRVMVTYAQAIPVKTPEPITPEISAKETRHEEPQSSRSRTPTAWENSDFPDLRSPEKKPVPSAPPAKLSVSTGNSPAPSRSPPASLDSKARNDTENSEGTRAPEGPPAQASAPIGTIKQPVPQRKPPSVDKPKKGPILSKVRKPVILVEENKVPQAVNPAAPVVHSAAIFPPPERSTTTGTTVSIPSPVSAVRSPVPVPPPSRSTSPPVSLRSTTSPPFQPQASGPEYVRNVLRPKFTPGKDGKPACIRIPVDPRPATPAIYAPQAIRASQATPELLRGHSGLSINDTPAVTPAPDPAVKDLVDPIGLDLLEHQPCLRKPIPSEGSISKKPPVPPKPRSLSMGLTASVHALKKVTSMEMENSAPSKADLLPRNPSSNNILVPQSQQLIELDLMSSDQEPSNVNLLQSDVENADELAQMAKVPGSKELPSDTNYSADTDNLDSALGTDNIPAAEPEIEQNIDAVVKSEDSPSQDLPLNSNDDISSFVYFVGENPIIPCMELPMLQCTVDDLAETLSSTVQEQTPNKKNSMHAAMTYLLREIGVSQPNGQSQPLESSQPQEELEDPVHETSTTVSEFETRQFHSTMNQKSPRPEELSQEKKSRGKKESKSKKERDVWGLATFQRVKGHSNLAQSMLSPSSESGLDDLFGLSPSDHAKSNKKHKSKPHHKTVFHMLEPLLVTARGFPGRLALEIQLGILLLPPTTPLGPMKISGLRKYFHPSTGLPPVKPMFNNRLAICQQDIDNLIGLEVGGRHIFDKTPFEESMDFEFHCLLSTGDTTESIMITIFNDEITRTSREEFTLGTIDLNFPGSVWDAAIVLKGQSSYVKLSKKVEEDIRTMSKSFRKTFSGYDVHVETTLPQPLEVKKIIKKQVTKHRYLRSGEGELGLGLGLGLGVEQSKKEDLYLKITENQELLISFMNFDKTSLTARCHSESGYESGYENPEQQPHPHRWYEASLISSATEDALETNWKLELGSKTTKWNTATLFGQGMAPSSSSVSSSPDSLIDAPGLWSLFGLAEIVVMNMDGVGLGLRSKSEKEGKAKAKATSANADASANANANANTAKDEERKSQGQGPSQALVLAESSPRKSRSNSVPTPTNSNRGLVQMGHSRLKEHNENGTQRYW